MNKEEKKAIERLDRKLTSEKFTKNIGMPVYIEDVETVLNLIQKQEAIIDKMAEQLTSPIHSKEWIIEFYKKEVEKDVKD